MLKIITNQLAGFLPQEHKLRKYLSIDPQNFMDMYKLFKVQTCEDICVYDLTVSKELIQGEMVMVKDHINNTGKNILIHQQKILNIDFIDLTNLYNHNKESIVTICCGTKLNIDKQYPSHYLCNITTLARAMNFNSITGYLYKATD